MPYQDKKKKQIKRINSHKIIMPANVVQMDLKLLKSACKELQCLMSLQIIDIVHRGRKCAAIHV